MAFRRRAFVPNMHRPSRWFHCQGHLWAFLKPSLVPGPLWFAHMTFPVCLCCRISLLCNDVRVLSAMCYWFLSSSDCKVFDGSSKHHPPRPPHLGLFGEPPLPLFPRPSLWLPCLSQMELPIILWTRLSLHICKDSLRRSWPLPPTGQMRFMSQRLVPWLRAQG